MTEEQQGPNTTPNEETASKTTAANRSRRPRAGSSKDESALVKPKHIGGLDLLPTPKGMPTNRPIEASKIHVVSTYGSMGATRPVGASTMEVSSTMTVSGNRPIALSHLHISEITAGNRPVASNEIDDPNTLMGYLD
ncbi:slr0476 [Synechocystis sp. PCC 6803]|jgi:hypothetical protein|uniref:Slr0476 protein n=1 Tax=Synechocystis sp. (strain ATCC 27184 / PCC 6803 / Kazusa) TaxID=1111708 RepID=Q55171_SYNY3|nr:MULTISPECIES: hypothetical protein [unclassified Synechocystis]BAM54340.1 hypothetical protein BEST7613_5409 [Synechocystis sp. PCC 6803] [Bacillus subtilis BEST7613]AGF52602.1 hypothetical protein MYO_123710 [Synechocystis sp. PCC 6803]ALJ68527.1 hypothetical protein AOY38_12195 [Synechocystis sp. PCC 6803]AVP90372.1 hypothetical protein C7I86_12275 [Synechocystis sp. IPPAS B-1465]MBD2616891.1 hypothetical protein [Synechocystis sp. FACHB-898]